MLFDNLMNQKRTHTSRDEMLKQRDQPWMVGVWDKTTQKAVRFKDGTDYVADLKTGQVLRLHPKPHRSKKERRAEKLMIRKERVKAVTAPGVSTT